MFVSDALSNVDAFVFKNIFREEIDLAHFDFRPYKFFECAVTSSAKRARTWELRRIAGACEAREHARNDEGERVPDDERE